MSASTFSAALHSRLSALRLRACDRVGPGARVHGRPHIRNDGRIEIGERLVLRSAPARSHLVTGPSGILTIGDAVEIGEGAGIAAHGSVTVGDGASIGPFTLAMDTNFHKPGDWRKAATPRSVHIGREARIGARVVLLPGAVIGDGAVVAADSVVAGRVPPGAHVAGLPARAPRERPCEGDVAMRVRTVVRDTFGLETLPELALTLRQVPGWNVLGGLGLLLALEEELQVAIQDDAWARAGSVHDVVAAAEAAVGTRRPS